MTIRPAWVVISCPDCGARAGVKCIRDDTTKRGELGDAMRISHRARTLRLRALRASYARQVARIAAATVTIRWAPGESPRALSAAIPDGASFVSLVLTEPVGAAPRHGVASRALFEGSR